MGHLNRKEPPHTLSCLLNSASSTTVDGCPEAAPDYHCFMISAPSIILPGKTCQYLGEHPGDLGYSPSNECWYYRDVCHHPGIVTAPGEAGRRRRMRQTLWRGGGVSWAFGSSAAGEEVCREKGWKLKATFKEVCPSLPQALHWSRPAPASSGVGKVWGEGSTWEGVRRQRAEHSTGDRRRTGLPVPMSPRGGRGL